MYYFYFPSIAASGRPFVSASVSMSRTSDLHVMLPSAAAAAGTSETR